MMCAFFRRFGDELFWGGGAFWFLLRLILREAVAWRGRRWRGITCTCARTLCNVQRSTAAGAPLTFALCIYARFVNMTRDDTGLTRDVCFERPVSCQSQELESAPARPGGLGRESITRGVCLSCCCVARSFAMGRCGRGGRRAVVVVVAVVVAVVDEDICYRPCCCSCRFVLSLVFSAPWIEKNNHWIRISKWREVYWWWSWLYGAEKKMSTRQIRQP
ncbi:unnamed protein product [Pylaiella littoralis]